MSNRVRGHRPRTLQVWISIGQIRPAPHDYYLTTGETVGTEQARFPNCNINWIRIRPPIGLERWPYVHDPDCDAFTTVAGWWSGEWEREIVDDRSVLTKNNKRVSFLEFVSLPRLTSHPVNGDYARHCRAAREFTEAYFDAKTIARRILDATLT